MSQRTKDLLGRVESRRREVAALLSSKHRARHGQFFTPSSAADFLAGLIELPEVGSFRLLDPGAGMGSLSAAVVARVMDERPALELHVTAFEIDVALVPHLTAKLEDCVATAAGGNSSIRFEVRNADFVDYATGWLMETPGQFDAVIANPPYRKVNTSAPERIATETRGLRASNLYTIFTGLAADLLVDGGQMSVIIPRSWANGPYHEPFRRFLLGRVGLDFLHVYEQRGKSSPTQRSCRRTSYSTGSGGRSPDRSSCRAVQELMSRASSEQSLPMRCSNRLTRTCLSASLPTSVSPGLPSRWLPCPQRSEISTST